MRAMRKSLCLLLAVCLFLMLAACSARQPGQTYTPESKDITSAGSDADKEDALSRREEPSPSGEDTASGQIDSVDGGFSYLHDPRENAAAMADILENADAVYGFSPDPASKRLGSYANYDWTDPEFVAKAREERRAYHESMDSMTDILYRMRGEGASIEEMARAVSAERNRLRLESCRDDPEGLAAVKESNLKTYGHEDGPTPDALFEQYGSWATVLQKAFSPNMGMDACCGLYDEYYQLYIELGYVD